MIGGPGRKREEKQGGALHVRGGDRGSDNPLVARHRSILVTYFGGPPHIGTKSPKYEIFLWHSFQSVITNFEQQFILPIKSDPKQNVFTCCANKAR